MILTWKSAHDKRMGYLPSHIILGGQEGLELTPVETSMALGPLVGILQNRGWIQYLSRH